MLTSTASKSKFALKMADGAQVRNIDDLKAHFNINVIVDYFCDGKLLTWLEDRYYDEEADAVRELSRHDKQLKQKLCAIFDMESAEQIAWRRERLERLQQYTDDKKILACVERVAFDQEDLAELLDEGVREIFLCANRFVIPLSMKNKTYIGVGKAVAVIRSKEPVDFAALNITFKGVDFDDSYKKIYNDLGQHERALQDYDKAIELKPKYAEMYYNRGNAYNDLRLYARAIQDYDKAIELNPSYAEAYNNRGNAYYNLGQHERAIYDFTKSIEFNNPRLDIVYRNRGNAYFDLGQYEQAIQDYSKAIELNPKYDLACYSRGNAYFNQQQYERAIQNYSKAIELNPSYAEAYNNRGNSYYNLGQYERAIYDFTKSIEFNNPRLDMVYYNRGNCYQALGNKAKAQADFAKAKSLGYKG